MYATRVVFALFVFSSTILVTSSTIKTYAVSFTTDENATAISDTFIFTIVLYFAYILLSNQDFIGPSYDKKHPYIMGMISIYMTGSALCMVAKIMKYLRS